MQTKQFIPFLIMLLSTFASIQAQLCWEKPINECKWVGITDFGISYQFVGSSSAYSKFDADVNLGIKRNITPKLSLGALSFMNVSVWGERNFHFGLRGRLAYKINENIDLGIAPGIILFDDGSLKRGFQGFSGELDLNWNNSYGLYARYVSQKYAHTNMPNNTLNIGFKTKGKKAVIIGGGLAILEITILTVLLVPYLISR